jgi:hypothetical protein
MGLAGGIGVGIFGTGALVTHRRFHTPALDAVQLWTMIAAGPEAASMSI